MELFKELERRVPPNLKTNRGSTEEMRSFNVFSKDHLDYSLFHSFLKLRKQKEDTTLEDIRRTLSGESRGKVILWNTTHSRQFRNFGQVCLMVDRPSHSLPTLDDGGVARRRQGVVESLSEEEQLLDKTRDTFIVILSNTVGSVNDKFDTSLWVGMLVRKAIIHLIIHENNNPDRLGGFVLNHTVLSAYIMSNFDGGRLFQLWDNESSMKYYLKNNVFKAKSSQPGDISDSHMEFMKRGFNVPLVRRSKALNKRRKYWVAALGDMSAEYLMSLYGHLNSDRAGCLAVDEKDFYANEGVHESLFNEEAVNLGLMMRESYNDMTVSSYLMYKVLLLRRLYIETRLRMGRFSMAEKKNEMEAEADLFVKVCRNFGLQSCRISKKPIRG